MQRRLVRDWQARFGHPVLLLETFVDPERFFEFIVNEIIDLRQ